MQGPGSGAPGPVSGAPSLCLLCFCLLSLWFPLGFKAAGKRAGPCTVRVPSPHESTNGMPRVDQLDLALPECHRHTNPPMACPASTSAGMASDDKLPSRWTSPRGREFLFACRPARQASRWLNHFTAGPDLSNRVRNAWIFIVFL